jgi:hypothetical protein
MASAGGRRRALDGVAELGSSKIVLWLPNDLHNAAFEKAASNANTEANPAFRHDDPEALSEWLRAQAGDTRPKVPILAMPEELIDLKDSSISLRTALHNAFYKIVAEVVQPAPRRWTFPIEELANQIKDVEGERVILAIHDLNTASNPTGRWHSRRSGRSSWRSR